MAPISDLRELLNRLAPCLTEGEYVFCSVAGATGPSSEIVPLAMMREPEGLSLVLRKEDAVRAGLAFEGPFRLVRLDVFSSLNAVGLTAAVATALAAEGISANVIAGYHHDHVLVPADRADDAMAALERLP